MSPKWISMKGISFGNWSSCRKITVSMSCIHCRPMCRPTLHTLIKTCSHFLIGFVHWYCYKYGIKFLCPQHSWETDRDCSCDRRSRRLRRCPILRLKYIKTINHIWLKFGLWFSIPRQRLHILRFHSELHLKVNIDPHRCFSFLCSIWTPGSSIGLKASTDVKIHCERCCIVLWPQMPQGSRPVGHFRLAPEIALNLVL